MSFWVSANTAVSPMTRSEIKAALASEIKTLVGLYHHRTQTPYTTIHQELNQRQGVQSQTMCTEAQLRERVRLLEQMMGR
ncbi:MAG: hypothetical protein KDD89_06155 [Anaerolineales bacterium]|nr:hypothetical protein [Anaerolineales bacterium]